MSGYVRMNVMDRYWQLSYYDLRYSKNNSSKETVKNKTEKHGKGSVLLNNTNKSSYDGTLAFAKSITHPI